tara:strand:+ start:27 stop:650 length:624 start_codon:yes stop_codon:yes gene_type:complete
MTDQVETSTPNAFDSLIEMANSLDEQAKSLRARASELRKAAKSIQKELKTAQAKSKKKRVKDPNAPKRQPAGFAKPTTLSPELCKFLDIDPSTLVARTDVTKKITEYIKTNNLQNPSNKREIVLDGPLRTLLNPPSDVVVTFFTLQTYLKPHFPSSKGNAEKSEEAKTEEVPPPAAKSVSKSGSNLEKKKLAIKKKIESSGRQKVAA